jgi:hypothetical protein
LMDMTCLWRRLICRCRKRHSSQPTLCKCTALDRLQFRGRLRANWYKWLELGRAESTQDCVMRFDFQLIARLQM